MNRLSLVFYSLCLGIFLAACNSDNRRVLSEYKEITHITSGLDDYWYQGKAEVTSYELTQNRYQDEHPGTAVMIFVSEDFLSDIQVKNDNYTNPNSIKVIKNNRIKKFTTGIYDYSMMTSVFTKTDRDNIPFSLKVTSSSQEWCGQTYHQINLKGNKFKSTLHSYFESEADDVRTENVTILEDELFNLIRINPDLLPKGEFVITPSLDNLRLRHKPFEPLKAMGSVKENDNPLFKDSGILEYKLSYPNESREVNIYFNKAKPYKIVGWTDAYPSMFDGKLRTTTAIKKAELFIPYWQQNKLEDAEMRTLLGI